MEYHLKIRDEFLHVDASPGNDRTIVLSLGKETLKINYTVISGNEIYLDVNGRAVVAYMAECSGGRTVMIDGNYYLVQDAESIDQESRKRGSHDIPNEVTPPMPSVVVRFMVQVGDKIEKGQCLVVVSSMKMETPINAPFSGEVTSINAAVGEKVMPGQILVTIKKVEDNSNE